MHGGTLGPLLILGLSLWMWVFILAASLVVAVLVWATVKASRLPGPVPIGPARSRNLAKEIPRRSIPFAPPSGHVPEPLNEGAGVQYTATLPAGRSPDLLELELVREGRKIHLDWWPPELPPDAFLLGFRLLEQRNGAHWIHRANLAPDVNGVDLDASDADRESYRVTAYQVSPVFLMRGGKSHDAQGASATL